MEFGDPSPGLPAETKLDMRADSLTGNFGIWDFNKSTVARTKKAS